MKKLLLVRYLSTATETMGRLYIDGKFFGYTLEDAIRPTKTKGETCIPFGIYKTKVTFSPRFKKNMPLVYNDKSLEVRSDNGDSWAGIRFHGGNFHKETDGCILVASSVHSSGEYKNFQYGGIGYGVKNWIQGSLSNELTVALQGKEVHELEIIRDDNFINEKDTQFSSLYFYDENMVMKSDNIVSIQNALNTSEYSTGLLVNGMFDKEMKEIVQKFQKSVGLITDGIVGAVTLAKLDLQSVNGKIYKL